MNSGKTKKELLDDIRGLRLKLKEAERGRAFDALTGLPNRFILYDRLSQAILHARRKGNALALIFLSLDDLKLINDSFGVGIGDGLLIKSAAILGGCLRKSDTVARPGRDEFIVLLPEIAGEEDAIDVAKKILSVFEEPITIDSRPISAALRMGVSLYPQDGLEADDLLKNAYTAMNAAKGESESNFKFYSREMNARAIERMNLEASLRSAIQNGELILHYQPQVSLALNKITGMEALVRWQHPGGCLVEPCDFIPHAEKTGLIVQLGEQVLLEACRQQRRWQDAGIAPERIAVNVSARQFIHDDLIKTVSRTLHSTGIPPQSLEIELTESLVFHNSGENISKLLRLKDMGVNISIDDFGAGHSSLSYIRQFPVDRLKLVGQFVRSISLSKADHAIAKLIIDLSRHLGLRVIAEEVETEEQLEVLRSLGCDEVQGFLFGRPEPAEAISRMLTERNTARIIKYSNSP